MSKYDVNFKRFALLMLPTFCRQKVLAGILYALVSPLNYLHTRFILFYRQTHYRLTHNGQVCYLRAALNENFDPIERRITLSDTGSSEGLTLYMREKELEKLVYKRECDRAIIINRRGFGGASGFDFWINIPYSLYKDIDATRLKAIVNTYKLASKRYEINYI
jgi:hypothetical protein